MVDPQAIIDTLRCLIDPWESTQTTLETPDLGSRNNYLTLKFSLNSMQQYCCIEVASDFYLKLINQNRVSQTNERTEGETEAAAAAAADIFKKAIMLVK